MLRARWGLGLCALIIVQINGMWMLCLLLWFKMWQQVKTRTWCANNDTYPRANNNTYRRRPQCSARKSFTLFIVVLSASLTYLHLALALVTYSIAYNSPLPTKKAIDILIFWHSDILIFWGGHTSLPWRCSLQSQSGQRHLMAAPEHASLDKNLDGASLDSDQWPFWCQLDQDPRFNLNGSGWMPGNRVLVLEGFVVKLLHDRLHRLHALRCHLLPAAVLLLPAVAEGWAAWDWSELDALLPVEVGLDEGDGGHLVLLALHWRLQGLHWLSRQTDPLPLKHPLLVVQWAVSSLILLLDEEYLDGW